MNEYDRIMKEVEQPRPVDVGQLPILGAHVDETYRGVLTTVEVWGMRRGLTITLTLDNSVRVIYATSYEAADINTVVFTALCTIIEIAGLMPFDEALKISMTDSSELFRVLRDCCGREFDIIATRKQTRMSTGTPRPRYYTAYKWARAT